MAARIGQLGVWTAELDRLAATAARHFVARVEQLGFPVVWIREGVEGKEAFSHAGLLLSATQRLMVASGIASIWARDPTAMANGTRTLNDAWGGRFVAGIGVSHAPVVARRGSRYQHPLEAMERFLDGMDAAPFDGPSTVEPPPRLLAALGPKMLRLAAERSLGAHPYFVPVEHTAAARRELGEAPLLAVEQAVVLDTHAETARATARRHMQRYLAAANYTNNLRRLGWGEDDLANGGSDRLVDALVAWGDLNALRDRVRAHLHAGADHVCVQPLQGEGSASTLDQLTEIARLLPEFQRPPAP